MHHRSGWADEAHPVHLAQAGKSWVFRQKSPPWMKRGAIGLDRCLDDSFERKVAFAASRRAKDDRCTVFQIRCADVGFRNAEYGRNAHGIAGLCHPNRDFASIGDKDPTKARGRTMSARFVPRHLEAVIWTQLRCNAGPVPFETGPDGLLRLLQPGKGHRWPDSRPATGPSES